MQGTIRHYYLPYHDECEVVVARNAHIAIPRHLHVSYCVGIQESGIRRVQLSGLDYNASAGDVLLICAGAAHACETLSVDGESYSMLSFPVQVLERIVSGSVAEHRSALGSMPPVLQDTKLHDALLRFFATIRRPHTSVEENECLNAALAALVECAEAGSVSRLNAGGRSAVPEVRQARAFLRTHFREDISLSELSAVVSISPYHLSRRFSREVGVPPHTYLTLLRLKEARRLLKEGASLADIALGCGFYDQAHFTHAFRKFNGVPPGLFMLEGNVS